MNNRRGHKPPSLQQLTRDVDDFNHQCPVGTDVILRKDDGSSVNTKVKLPATVLGGHTAVAWLDGQASCWNLDRVTRNPTCSLCGQPTHPYRECGETRVRGD